jgi:hypothetical protein
MRKPYLYGLRKAVQNVRELGRNQHAWDMRWKNPDELRKLGFRLKGLPTAEDLCVEYDLCLADDENAVSYEIRLAFNKESPQARLSPALEDYSHSLAGAELFIHKLERETLGGPFYRGAFVASRPLFFGSFRDVEIFVAALTGATPLFPEDREPVPREVSPDMEDLFHSALSVLRTG